MKQIIVNVGDLPIEEKQHVNEALSKINNISAPKITNMRDVKWFYSDAQIAWSYGVKSWVGMSATHTPQQVLEMAGMATDTEQVILADTLIITDSSGSIIYDSTLGAWNHLIKQQFNPDKGEAVMVEKRKVRKGHVHSELMANYAEDAKTHPEPWLLWQNKAKDGFWWDCLHSPLWASTTGYRRKPKTHTVNGVEIPDLRVTPEEGDKYYLADPLSRTLFTVREFNNNRADKDWVERGLVYQHTEEGKQAAILHSKSMLGIA